MREDLWCTVLYVHMELSHIERSDVVIMLHAIENGDGTIRALLQ